MQVIYQITSAYFQDDCADELTNDPVMTAILEKDRLASQPTLSRFWNRMDNDTLTQFDQIGAAMRRIIYSIEQPAFMLVDLDSTLLDTYGSQEGEGFNVHYHRNAGNKRTLQRKMTTLGIRCGHSLAYPSCWYEGLKKVMKNHSKSSRM